MNILAISSALSTWQINHVRVCAVLFLLGQMDVSCAISSAVYLHSPNLEIWRIIHCTLSFIALPSTPSPSNLEIHACVKPWVHSCLQANSSGNELMMSSGLPCGWRHVLRMKSHDCATKPSSSRIITLAEKYTDGQRQRLENPTLSQTSRSPSASSHSDVWGSVAWAPAPSAFIVGIVYKLMNCCLRGF